MEMCFVSRGINNFLEVNLGNIEDILASGNYYKIRMLEENSIPYVISPVYSDVDGSVKLSFCSDVGYVLERVLMKNKPDGDMLRLVIGQVLDCIEKLGEYLLVAEDLVLAPEYMMFDMSEKKLRMIYVPGYGMPIKEQLKRFLEHFMKVFDHNDKRGICGLYDLYDIFCEDRLDIGAVKNILEYKQEHKQNIICIDDELTFEDENRLINHTEDYRKVFEENLRTKRIVGLCIGGVALVAAVFCGLYYVLISKATICLIMCIGLLMLGMATGVLFLAGKKGEKKEEVTYLDDQNGDDYSVILPRVVEQSEDLPPEKINRLVPLANGGLDIIYTNMYEGSIVIGRGKKDTDYRLPTTQISRVHAYLHLREGGIYVEDKGSTNGTYINSNRLNPFKEYLISKGDIIAFANEEFFAS